MTLHYQLYENISTKGNNTLLILNHRTSVKVFINGIILVEGNANYTKFYMKQGKERVVVQPIKYFESYLRTHGFLRVHRTFMINPNCVKMYDEEQNIITMSNEQIANILRRRRRGILKDLMA